LSSAARTILVTGFEPFGGETVNASWEAAKKLDGWRHDQFVAVARLLPCAYDSSVAKLIHEIEATRPEALLMTGQAARRAAVSVERFGRNLDDAAAADNDGVLRTAMRISGGGPTRLEATASASATVRAIKEAGIPARISTDAGGFVCNHLYFGALNYLANQGRAIPAVFVHLPVTPEQTPPGASAKRMTSGRAADALRAAAAAMIGASKPVETG
jgi:pyroglutamyl-peptidase